MTEQLTLVLVCKWSCWLWEKNSLTFLLLNLCAFYFCIALITASSIMLNRNSKSRCFYHFPNFNGKAFNILLLFIFQLFVARIWSILIYFPYILYLFYFLKVSWGFPGDSDSKEPACKARDLGLIPGLGRCLGEGNGYPLRYSCLENSMDRGAWRATVHGGCKESDTTERLSH